MKVLPEADARHQPKHRMQIAATLDAIWPHTHIHAYWYAYRQLVSPTFCRQLQRFY